MPGRHPVNRAAHLSVVGRIPAACLRIAFATLIDDRPLDMYRTAVNVFSDSCGAAIIARSEGEEGIDAEVR